ncbi:MULTISPECIES: hypothetical protein [unclassified Acidocella]|uniref:hypothetical protein n=1 Tax=unclassified Acidocella TaxID=2648610 RepID=UPI00034B4300|nr:MULTISPECIES: hypothetical protein [unclassified Acidocella]WBO60425.1 hypothetical protein GT370_06445 [Acidocella sp. MX-AZ03]
MKDVYERIGALLETSKGDPELAIAGYYEIYKHDGFFPWGAHYLMELLRNSGVERLGDARRVAEDQLKNCPEFTHSWWPQLTLFRGTSQYENFCREILRYTNFEIFLNDEAPRLAVLNALLLLQPANYLVTLGQLYNSKHLEFAEISAFQISISFFGHVRSATDFTKFLPGTDCWTLAFDHNKPVVYKDKNLISLNIAYLEVKGFEGWTFQLAIAFMTTASALFNWPVYSHDRGYVAWTNVTDADFFLASLYNTFVNPLRWLQLRPSPLSSVAEQACDFRDTSSYPAAIFSSTNPKFYVRAGNVELFALRSYFESKSNSKIMAEHVACHALRAKNEGLDFSASPYNYPQVDLQKNIISLQTNAGWYAMPGHAAVSFEDWAGKYYQALRDGVLLSGHDEELLGIAAAQPDFRSKKIYSWNDDAFIKFLDRQRVTLATAYSEEISEGFESGKIARLWRDLGFESTLSNFSTVPSPYSVWPFYPNQSWTQTYEAFRDSVFSDIEANRTTLFVAACGCYGLPIVHEVSQHFKINSVYYGHHSNLLFGLITEDGRRQQFYAKNPSSKNWVQPRIKERMPEVGRIDDGRYV